MIRVCLIGPESTGKTTTAIHLASAFGTSWSEEFARTHAADRKGALGLEDVGLIAEGQRAAIDAAIASAAPAVVIHDTDLVSTVVYSRHYYASCPSWIEEQAAARLADLYLLFYPDVPWLADGIRDRGENRSELWDEFASTLDEFGARWVDIAGDWCERILRSEAAVRALLGGG